LDGRYRVVRHLGSGGMESVLLCEDERLGRQVAVKRLHADSPVDVELRFNREAKLGASLNHPNLVSVFDTATDDEGVLIVMEYVEGEPLSRMLRRGPLRPEEVSAMVRDLGDALDHAHAQGVIHRDVKPSNVLIREDGLTKLADLGIATASDGTKITRSGVVLGTAAYMAPEQLDGRRAGPAVDVYALAAISFEALGGKRPREGRTPMEIAHKIATEGAPDLRDVWPTAPKGAVRVLQRGMARDPEDRPASAGEFATELCEALEETPEKTRKTRFLRRGSTKRAAAPAAAAAPAVGAAAQAPAKAASSTPAAAPRAPDGVERAAPAPARDPQPDPTPTPKRAAQAAPSPSRASASRPIGPAAAKAAGGGNGRGGVAASRPADRGGRRPRVTAFVLAGIFVALAAATIAGAVLSGGDDGGSSPSSADNTPAKPKADANKKKKEPAAKKEQEKQQPEQQAEEPPAAAPAPAPEEQPSGTASYDPERGAALNDDGFTLLNRGDYNGAVAKLQEAVKLFPSDSTDIRYAYALYNLGKSLRLAGRPDEAIPYLEKRLNWSDQRDTVQRELDLARQQAGQG
jgi:eukaryotic-like serine/threonine-protein kinase